MDDFENRQSEEQTAKGKDILLAVIITEAVCIALIILGILLLKYFSTEGFGEAKDFYSEHFLTETALSEVIDYEI